MSLKLETARVIPMESSDIFRDGRSNEALTLARSMALMVFINHGDRNLPQLTPLNDMVIHKDVLPQLAINIVSKHSAKLGRIGLTEKTHIALYAEAFLGRMKSVKRIVRTSQEHINHKKYVASKTNESLEDRKIRHRAIVDRILKDVPTAKEPGKQQKIVIIAGPIASGKSEIYRNRLQSKEYLSIDLDEIRKYLSKNYNATNQHDIQRVREESWRVSDILAIEALKQGKSILMQTPLHRRKRWLKDPTLIHARDNNIPIEIHMILRPMHDCIARNIDREKRSSSMKDMLASMKGMSVLMKFVKKFANVTNVTLVDFWPMLKKSQGISPKAFEIQYKKLIEYAKKRPDIFKIYTRESELEILPE